ncbi:MAG: FCD domain-containing protein [Bacillota bacterium]|nr:FCD domain-containing protein [Bacillota bacterium]
MSVPELELDVLSALDSSDRPMGACLLHMKLKDKHHIGQATIGRMLLELDGRGLTTRHAYAGRKITAEGKAYLDELSGAAVFMRERDMLLETLTAQDARTLFAVLEVRYGLEGYCAYLAADRATEDDIACLRDVLRQDEEAFTRGESGDREDALFHETVARAAHNPVLEHTVKLVRQASVFAPVIASILRGRLAEGEQYPDLYDILDRIEQREPDGAREKMCIHIDKMKRELEAFLAKRDGATHQAGPPIRQPFA